KRLVECPFIGCAVTENHHDHLVSFSHFDAQTDADGNWYTTRNNTICAKVIRVHIRDVHTPAASPAEAGFLAHEFRDHPVGVGTPGEAVSMSAMMVEEIVTIFEGIRRADRGCFLPD